MIHSLLWHCQMISSVWNWTWLMKMRKYHQKRNNFKMCWNKRQMLCLVASQVSNNKFNLNNQFEILWFSWIPILTFWYVFGKFSWKFYIQFLINYWPLLNKKINDFLWSFDGKAFFEISIGHFRTIFVNLSLEGENGGI